MGKREAALIVIGIDPGLNGALCLLDTEYGIVELIEMPVFRVIVGGKLRQRIDLTGLRDVLTGWKLWEPKLVVLEEVAARPRQSGMFAFGYVQGAIEATCMCAGLHVERITPKKWKNALRVGVAADEVSQRAEVAGAKRRAAPRHGGSGALGKIRCHVFSGNSQPTKSEKAFQCPYCLIAYVLEVFRCNVCGKKAESYHLPTENPVFSAFNPNKLSCGMGRIPR
jgi:Holliday junction resolvasome RuvABC endonuclease subunit